MKHVLMVNIPFHIPSFFPIAVKVREKLSATLWVIFNQPSHMCGDKLSAYLR